MPWQLGDRWSLAVGVLGGPDWADWSQRLRVSVVESSRPVRRFEANTWARLATFERQGREVVEITPSEPDLGPLNPVRADLDGKMELRGYDVSPTVGKAGRDLELTLYWRAQAPMDRDYTIFVHLVDSDGQLVAQHDGQPWWEASLPTSTWDPGEELQDRHVLTLPPDTPPGSYSLRVGAYYWETLERLPVVESGVAVGDYVELGRFEVER
jgi:hypothetical protein